MSGQSRSSHLQVLFDAALSDYENQTGIALANHPLAEQLQNCDSVESVTAVLRGRTQAFSEFQGKEKLSKHLEKAVSVLYKLSATANLGGLVRLYAINSVLNVLNHLIEFPACCSNKHRPRCPILCMCLSLVPNRPSS